MTLVSCWVLDLPSLFTTPTRSSLDPDGRHAVRPIADLLSKHYDAVQSAATREQVDPAVATFVGCFGRLWRVPWENGYKEAVWCLAVNGVRAAGACQRYFSAPCPCGVVASGAHEDCKRLLQHAFWECVSAQAGRTQVQRGLGGALLQQWHLWLVDPPPSVCEMV
jgi:hypothetical protein